MLEEWKMGLIADIKVMTHAACPNKKVNVKPFVMPTSQPDEYICSSCAQTCPQVVSDIALLAGAWPWSKTGK